MPLSKRLLTLAAPIALLSLGACATGLPTSVSRFQAMPAPQGQSFVVEPARPQDRGGLEFSQYASLVRAHLIGLGYREAPSRAAATFTVTLDYGVDNGHEKIQSYPDPFGYGGYGYGGFGYGGFGYGRFGGFYGGGFGRGFAYGWNDPFWFGGGYGADITSYTIYTSFLAMDIRRNADHQSLFEGTAKARSQSDDLPRLVPDLVEAMFTNFPGRSGETVRITIPPPGRESADRSSNRR